MFEKKTGQYQGILGVDHLGLFWRVIKQGGEFCHIAIIKAGNEIRMDLLQGLRG